ncbi:MAG: hypothetical protein Pg6C_00930 [Treponemataceae bacterium]|nr:MAG: hypothetical protein Pg6C_00930 [Treponemataceae bacterium]
MEEGKTEFERLLSVLPEGREEQAKKAGFLNARTGNQNAPGIIAAGMLIPDRREIIQRDDGVVTPERYMLNQQKSGIHEVSKMRRLAALAAADCREKVSNFTTFAGNGIAIGDRGYCSKQGITRLLERDSGFVFRFGTNRFHLYTPKGRTVNVLGSFRD